MKDEAKVIGRRWDHSANGYNDIIQREFTEAGEAWTQLLTEYAPATGKRALDVGCGPGVLAMIPCSLLMKALGKKLIYIESFAKVTSQTLSGRLLYKYADQFYVQWKEMLEFYPNAIYKGGIY